LFIGAYIHINIHKLTGILLLLEMWFCIHYMIHKRSVTGCNSWLGVWNWYCRLASCRRTSYVRQRSSDFCSSVVVNGGLHYVQWNNVSQS